MKIFFLAAYVFLVSTALGGGREERIKQFVHEELTYYPEARLADIYKNNFQDAFGPGHLIPDTAHAGAYLDWELNQPDWPDTVLYQALGPNHDFYRINLLLVKKNIIPRDTLLLAMVSSSTRSRNPDITAWKREWKEVLGVIKHMKLHLPGLRSDETVIASAFAQGEVMMHHSKHYEETYHPHYRIIHRSIFERWQKTYFRQLRSPVRSN